MEDNGVESEENPFENPRVEEMQYFDNLFETEVEDAFMNVTPPTSRELNPDKVAYLHWNDNTGTQAADKAVGPSIALKVNAGDKITLEAWTRYEDKLTFTRDLDLIAISALLGNTFVSQVGFEGATSFETGNTLLGGLTGAGYGSEDDNMAPHAYLNYIIYDENMVYQHADWQRVPETAASDQSELYIPENKPVKFGFNEPVVINQSGYIYIWLSNESKDARVWFDDLTVTHTQNLVVQATDYGVWGDVLREQRSDESKYRFGYQGQFAEKDEETGWNHFELREYDPVIGRWMSTDPYGQHWSPYLSMGNNPINLVDPDGGCDDCPDPTLINNDPQLQAEANILSEMFAGTPNQATVIVEDFAALLQSLISANPKFGIRFWGNNDFGPGGEIFKGRDWKPGMTVIDVNITDINSVTSLLQRTDLKRGKIDNTTLQAKNLNIQERLEKVAQGIASTKGASDVLWDFINTNKNVHTSFKEKAEHVHDSLRDKGWTNTMAVWKFNRDGNKKDTSSYTISRWNKHDQTYNTHTINFIK